MFTVNSTLKWPSGKGLVLSIQELIIDSLLECMGLQSYIVIMQRIELCKMRSTIAGFGNTVRAP
jgi:hypothetical protein